MYYEMNKDGKTEEEIKILQEMEKRMNTVKMRAIVGVKGYEEKQFESNEIINTISNKLTNNNLSLSIESSFTAAKPGAKYQFGVNVSTGMTQQLDKKATVEWKVPDGLEFKEATREGVYDETTRTVTWKFDTLNPYTAFNIVFTVSKLPEGIYHKDIILQLEGELEGLSEKSKSNQIAIAVDTKGKTEITQTSNITGKYIKAGEEITYTIKLKNPAPSRDTITFYNVLPNGLRFVKGSVIQDGKTSSLELKSANEITKSLLLQGKEEVIIYITAKADDLEYNREIKNEPYIKQGSNNIKANALTHTILGAKGEKPGGGNSGDNDNDNLNNKYTYSISGTAWLDENKDGKRDEIERKLAGIRTYLLNSKDNSIVQTTMTDTNGAYSFANVQVRKLYSSI